MDRRRLIGVGVLAAAVLAWSVGAGLGRPSVVGTAAASPIDPPPAVGDCLYAASAAGVAGFAQDDGTWLDYAYGRSYGPCRAPWNGEVVAVRSASEMEADDVAAQAGDSSDPCAVGMSDFLGRPRFEAVDAWRPAQIYGLVRDADPRQQSVGPPWRACVLGSPGWDVSGNLVTWDAAEQVPSTDETMRGRWREPAVRDRWGSCQSGPVIDGEWVFCGHPHDRELLAFSTSGEPTAAAPLIEGCARQAAVMMGRDDPTAGGLLVIQVQAWDIAASGMTIVPADSTVESTGSATCVVRTADPTRHLTATVIDLGDRSVPITPD